MIMTLIVTDDCGWRAQQQPAVPNVARDRRGHSLPDDDGAVCQAEAGALLAERLKLPRAGARRDRRPDPNPVEQVKPESFELGWGYKD
jgi:hypothetical protein